MPAMPTFKSHHATSLYLLLRSASSESSVIESRKLSKILISLIVDSATAEPTNTNRHSACSQIQHDSEWLPGYNMAVNFKQIHT